MNTETILNVLSMVPAAIASIAISYAVACIIQRVATGKWGLWKP